MNKKVLIIDEPETCGECPICSGYALDGYVCGATGEEELAYDEEHGRPEYCPLQELPGRIDICSIVKASYRNERIYISGPITGTNDYIKRFAERQKVLEAEGYTVVNPAAINAQLPENTAYEEYMQMAFLMLDMCDVIYMMKGWEQSRGAVREYEYARAKRKIVMYET